MENSSRCSRASCNCTVAGVSEYCGAQCRDQAVVERVQGSEGELACGCGHADCYRQDDSGLTSEEDLEI